MRPSYTILVLLCMIIVACILVWVCLYFAKRHVKKKTAMSKAYYRRAREGIPNNIDVELGLQSKNPCTVQLAPYRYVNRHKEVNMVRPKKAMRTGRVEGKLRGTDFHIHHKPPSRRSALSINGSNHHHQQQQQSARQAKKQKQKQKQKQKGKGNRKRKEQRHEQEEPKQPTDDGWNQPPDHHSRHSNQEWTSNRGSHAGTEQQGHDDHHHTDNNNEQGGFVSWDNENHDNNHDHGHHGTGDWTQHAEEEHRSHHGSTNMPGGWHEWEAHHDDHGHHESQKW